MYFKALTLFSMFFLVSNFSGAQNCTLDIGGKNSKTIVEIFQLSAAQRATMELLQEELAVTTEEVESKVQKVLQEDPQSNEEDLIKLAKKYKELQQELVNASWESDKKLLSLFNPKQYKAYLDLCRAANRDPIQIIPVIYQDSIAPR